MKCPRHWYLSTNYMKSHPTRPEPSSLLLWESQISNPNHTKWHVTKRCKNLISQILIILNDSHCMLRESQISSTATNKCTHTPIKVLPDNRPERSKTHSSLMFLNILLWIKYNTTLCIFWLILWKLKYNAWSKQYKKIISNSNHTVWHVTECCEHLKS